MAKHHHRLAPVAKVADPVCGVAISPEVAAGTHAYKSEKYYFCSSSCLERFKESPKQFMDKPSGGDAITARNARLANIVPLPYSRVAVQHVDFPLNEPELRSFMRGKEAWFETDYVVFRRGNDCAVVELRKESRKDMFSRITEIGIISLPDTSQWVQDFTVDTGNPSALAEKARAMGITGSETLVVSGLYEHVNFIHRPQPTVIDLFDLSPPEPPRLLDMTRRVIASRSFPAIVLHPRIESIAGMVPGLGDKPILFPCGVSQLKSMVRAFYLDERPSRQDWILVGCERSRQIHSHIYGAEPPRIELCPRKLFAARDALALMRCCMVKATFELRGKVAVVPWGADLCAIEEAIRALLNQRRSASESEKLTGRRKIHSL